MLIARVELCTAAPGAAENCTIGNTGCFIIPVYILKNSINIFMKEQFHFFLFSIYSIGESSVIVFCYATEKICQGFRTIVHVD